MMRTSDRVIARAILDELPEGDLPLAWEELVLMVERVSARTGVGRNGVHEVLGFAPVQGFRYWARPIKERVGERLG